MNGHPVHQLRKEHEPSSIPRILSSHSLSLSLSLSGPKFDGMSGLALIPPPSVSSLSRLLKPSSPLFRHVQGGTVIARPPFIMWHTTPNVLLS